MVLLVNVTLTGKEMVDTCNLIVSVKSHTHLLASGLIEPCFVRPSVLQSNQRIVAGFYLICNSYQPLSPLSPLSEEMQHCHFQFQEQAQCWKPSAANLVHIPSVFIFLRFLCSAYLIVSNWEQQMTGNLSYSILVTASCLLNFCADWFVMGRSEV